MTRPVVRTCGVLGGTFDPVHAGHVHIALEAGRLLGLPRTLLVPAANPPHKSVDALSSAHHRISMLRLAIEGLEGLGISLIEMERPGVGYTIDTLRALREDSPRRDPVFILGMDSLGQIETWHRWRELLDEFDLAVIDRGGAFDNRPESLPREVAGRLVPVGGASPDELRPGAGGRIFRVPVEPMAVSSSDIRQRARSGGDLSGLVPPGVARYIRTTGLYRQEKDH